VGLSWSNLPRMSATRS